MEIFAEFSIGTVKPEKRRRTTFCVKRLIENVFKALDESLRVPTRQTGQPRRNALFLATDRRSLSPAVIEALDLLARLTAGDYVAAAEVSVRELVAAYVPYADPTALRARITGR